MYSRMCICTLSWAFVFMCMCGVHMRGIYCASPTLYLLGVILLFLLDGHFEHFQLCLSLADFWVVVRELVHHLAHAVWSRSLQHSVGGEYGF